MLFSTDEWVNLRNSGFLTTGEEVLTTMGAKETEDLDGAPLSGQN